MTASATLTVLLQRHDDTPTKVQVETRPSGVPGLMITPRLDGNAEPVRGRWGVTHEASTRLVAYAGLSLERAQRVARALGGLPVDWTADADTVKAWIGENRAAFDAALKLGGEHSDRVI